MYITTNPGRTVLYTGVTNDLRRRLREHFQNRGNKATFAGKYYCYDLIYYEYFTDIQQAIARDKEIKNMIRDEKKELIASKNPGWHTLRIG